MEAFMPFLSLAGSAFSTVLTVVFWVSKYRRELPDLRAHLVDRELFLGAGTAEQRQLGLKLGIVVANYSALPNAILGVRLALKGADGNWVAVQDVAFDKQTPMPFNTPALTTVLLRVNGRVAFPYAAELEQGNIAGAYAGRYLANPREVRVELQGLNDRTFTDTLAYAAPS